jgi:hypothetical protein
MNIEKLILFSKKNGFLLLHSVLGAYGITAKSFTPNSSTPIFYSLLFSVVVNTIVINSETPMFLLVYIMGIGKLFNNIPKKMAYIKKGVCHKNSWKKLSIRKAKIQINRELI